MARPSAAVTPRAIRAVEARARAGGTASEKALEAKADQAAALAKKSVEMEAAALARKVAEEKVAEEVVM